MTATIIDYGVGNLASIANIVRRVGSTACVTADHDEIREAENLVLPGVGAFDTAREKMIDDGLDDLIRDRAAAGVPILGICLGMQLLCNGSEEGRIDGLGLIDADVRKFEFPNTEPLPLPHMGWNNVQPQNNCPLFASSSDGLQRFYFVHSYFVRCANDVDVAGLTDYGSEFVSAFQHKNIFGVQFHPEKSHKFGMDLFRRFLSYQPTD